VVLIAVSILVGIVPVGLLILLVLMIASVVGVKRGHEESLERGNEMIKTVYVYLILFATLMMTIGGTVAAFMAAADIVSNEKTTRLITLTPSIHDPVENIQRDFYILLTYNTRMDTSKGCKGVKDGEWVFVKMKN